MKEIGLLFGKTSHKVGKRLKEMGLRTADGKPSREAFEAGFVEQRWTSDNLNYCWAWHAEKAIKLLQESGLGDSEAKGQDGNTFLNAKAGREGTREAN
jgi:hypothetical protein